MKTNFLKNILAIGVILFAQGTIIFAQNCVEPSSSDWKMRKIVGGLKHATNMDILPDGRVFFSEMWTGGVQLYTPGQGLKKLGQIEVYTRKMENGFLGVIADLNYDQTKWIYALYSRALADTAKYKAGDKDITPHEQVLVRYTIANDTLTNEKELLIIPRYTIRHAAGGLEFNPLTGNLYITTGDDSYPGSTQSKYGPRSVKDKHSDGLRTSGNTNDVRGKVLRIKPIPFPDTQTPVLGVGTTYEIPSDNLFPVGMAKTRPEIYTMGHRNPYHFKIDPISRWGIIGEVGPDGGNDDPKRGIRGHDEYNLVTGAGNYGWPFFTADSSYIAITDDPYSVGQVFDKNNLQNLSVRNTGLKNLPPVIDPIAWYTKGGGQTGALNGIFNRIKDGESAMAGPMYRYDASLNSTVKFPPYYHGKFIVGEYVRSRLFTFELNAEKKMQKIDSLRSGIRNIDLDFGPKGELYILSYGSNGSLNALEYTGKQYSLSECSSFVPPKFVPSSIAKKGMTKSNLTKLYVQLGNQSISLPKGVKQVKAYNLKGEEVYLSGNVSNQNKMRLPKNIKGMVYLKFIKK